MSCPDGFWCLQAKDIINFLILIATIFAICYGPIWAVRISRNNDEERDKRRRQYDIFNNLMKTRRAILQLEHVTSLNLIQIEFFHHDDIIEAYKKYIGLLSRESPKPGDPQSTIKRFYDDQDDGLYQLVHEIGKSLGMLLDKHDLMRYAYSPVGWVNTENQAITFRSLVIDLLTGRRALPVANFSTSNINDKFPPPPT